jgi:hypothetical protein
MKRLALLIAFAILAGVVALTARAARHAAAQQAASIYLTEIPSGYRDWRLISVAHEEGDFHSFAAVLGNDVAIEAYRGGKLPFPDGTIIAALHYRHVASQENNKAFGRDQSFVPGSPTNIQFMVKDSKKYAATGGWGFGHFQDGKPSTDEAMMKMLRLPSTGESSRPRLHALRTIETGLRGNTPRAAATLRVADPATWRRPSQRR